MLLFVYGTLRYGFELNHLLRNSPFIGLGYVEGFKMYDLGGYPGCVKGDGTIWGEVYQVSEELLRKLDEVEGYSGTPDDLYERTSVTVNFDQKRKYKLSGVQMYVYRRSIDDKYVIREGDFSSHMGMSKILNYFAYAENTNTEVMKYRGLTKIMKEFRAYAPGFRIVFSVPCRWGLCASLKEGEGKVCGYVYLTTADQLAVLDRAEHYLSTYMRDSIPVVDERGITYFATVYFTEEKEEGSPSHQYLQIILDGLRRGWGDQCRSTGLDL